MGKEYDRFDRCYKDIFDELPIEILFQMVNYNIKTTFDKTINLKNQLSVGIWMIQYKFLIDNLLEFLKQRSLFQNKLEIS